MAAKTLARQEFVGRIIGILSKDVREFGLAEMPIVNPPITQEQVDAAIKQAGLLRVIVGTSEIVVPRSAEYGNCRLETTWSKDLANVRKIKLARS